MKNYKIEFKWGIIFILAGLLWMAFERAMGWHGERIEDHPVYTNFFALVAIVIYLLALLDKRKNFYRGIMTWKQGFMAGMIMTIVIAVLTPLSQYITHTFISPDYFENVIRYSVDNQLLTREEAEAQFNLQHYMLMSFLFALVVGAITSAVIAIFVRKK